MKYIYILNLLESLFIHVASHGFTIQISCIVASISPLLVILFPDNFQSLALTCVPQRISSLKYFSLSIFL